MAKRTLVVDWKSFERARPVQGKLYLKANDAGIFLCPIQQCLQYGFKSKRGYCRHTEKEHFWYYWFAIILMVKDDIIMAARQTGNHGVYSKKQSSFSIEVGVGRDFKQSVTYPMWWWKKC